MLENKLKELIIEKFGSIRQFSLKIDIPYTTVDSILKRGIDNSNVGNVIKMCKALNLSIDNLLDNKENISNLNFDNAKLIDLPNDNVKISVLGRIPAGIPFEAIEEQYAIDFEEIPRDWLKGGKEYFALKLEGNSMEPEYHNNDIVIFEKKVDCESGQDCCIKINGFDATFKRVKKQENGIMIIPLNENNDTGFSSTFYTKDDIINKPIQIIGVVKQVRRNK
jgi:repressor LexA